MLIATESDFYGGYYTHYRHHEGYRKRAELFKGFPEPVLVVGCGFGFLVAELLKLGKRADGIDASPYAVSRRVTEHVCIASVLDDMAPLGKFSTVITEDVLPCLTDKEAERAANNCALVAPIVIHLVTTQGTDTRLNYHSTGYWMTLTKQFTVSLEGM